MNGRWVEIEFECLPLRSISRLDVPVDASPAYEQFVLRVKAAMERHGSFNTYYLHRGSCTFHLTNDPGVGRVTFGFEGTLITDQSDLTTRAADVEIKLSGETCSWLSEPIVEFFIESARRALVVEFNRYIAAGDLKRTEERIQAIEQQSDEGEGFVGMYL